MGSKQMPLWDNLDTEATIIRGIWYGDPGTRKTTAMATMANLGTIYVIDTEQGLKSLPLKRHGVDVTNIRTIRDVTYDSLEDLVAQLRAQNDAGDLDVIGIVLDSVTALTGSLLQNLMQTAVIKAQRTGQERFPWKIQRDDYGDMTAQVRNIYRGLRDLPLHLAISAHSRRDQDEDGSVRVGPAVGPALQQDLIGYSDLVIRTSLHDDPITGVGITKPVGRFEAKDRFDVLPTIMVDPTFERVSRYVAGTLTEQDDMLQNEIIPNETPKKGK